MKLTYTFFLDEKQDFEMRKFQFNRGWADTVKAIKEHGILTTIAIVITGIFVINESFLAILPGSVGLWHAFYFFHKRLNYRSAKSDYLEVQIPEFHKRIKGIEINYEFNGLSYISGLEAHETKIFWSLFTGFQVVENYILLEFNHHTFDIIGKHEVGENGFEEINTFLTEKLPNTEE